MNLFCWKGHRDHLHNSMNESLLSGADNKRMDLSEDCQNHTHTPVINRYCERSEKHSWQYFLSHLINEKRL